MPKKQINEEELAKAIRKISPEMPQRFADRMEQTLQKIVGEEAKRNREKRKQSASND